MPWIDPLPTGKFRPAWRDSAGTKRKGPSCASREEADAWIAANALRAKRTPTLAELVDSWAKMKGGTDYARKVQSDLARVFNARGWVRVDAITKAALEAWHTAAGGKGVRRPQQYLLQVLRWAHAVHQVDVAADVLALKPRRAPRKPPRRLLTDSEAVSIREMALSYGPAAHAVIDYLLTYGARPITACRLLLGDLDVSRQMLVIRSAKHSGGWEHPVLERHVEAWVGLHPADALPTAPLFPHYRDPTRAWKITHGSAMEIANWYKNTISKRLKLSSVSGGIYDLKRYAITSALARGLDPQTVADFTGHLDLEQVLTYAGTNDERKREALAKLDPLPPKVPPCPHAEQS